MKGAMQRGEGGVNKQRQTRRLAQLLADASIEVSPRDDPAREGLSQLLAPGTAVFVNHPGSVTHHDIVAACVRLRQAGFSPVPHIAARRLASFTQARDFLRRAADEAGVTSVLLIAGDAVQPAGPFRDAGELLATGLIEHHGVRRVFVAGYPEGHPLIDRHSLDAALRAKLTAARQHGLCVNLITQFGFAAAPVAAWVAKLRDEAIMCPVRVGIAGPASIATLAKFAVRCGIGASLRALGRGQTAFARILTEATPDKLIADLIGEADAADTIDGLHFFSFGGARRTASWLRDLATLTRALAPAPE
jgi:methylenetetrahydrofolate reductase (NADPH)